MNAAARPAPGDWLAPKCEVVVCACNKVTVRGVDNNLVYHVLVCGARHMDVAMQSGMAAIKRSGLRVDDIEQGFINQFGHFLTRENALIVAERAGQINVRRQKTFPLNQLFSEDLY